MRHSILIAALIALLSACGGGGGASDAGGDASTVDSATPDATTDSTTRDAARDASTDSAIPVDSAMPDAATDACGGCPAGTLCGDTAGGVVACLSASGIPRFSHVFVVVMENTSLSRIMDATNTPFIHSLFADYASSSNYHGVTHPSLGNYLSMTSGMDTSVIGCDCEPTGRACSSINCNAVLHACGCAQAVTHLGDQLEAAGLSWMDYAEDMGTPCNTENAGDYVARHVPFLYYPNVQGDAARCVAHVVDYAGFRADLAADAPTYSLIAPNLVHDMHDPIISGSSNLANGDTWLAGNVPAILESAAYMAGGLLVVVWDEDDLSGTLAPDDPIGLIVMSPFAAHGGYLSTTHADHSSLLATIEDGLGLERLGSATAATPLSDFFAP